MQGIREDQDQCHSKYSNRLYAEFVFVLEEWIGFVWTIKEAMAYFGVK